MREFPLKAYRISVRKPTLRVDEERGAVELFLPGYFGRHRWHLLAKDIAVIEAASAALEAAPTGALLATPPLVPYLFTTGPATAPNLCLLFKVPQRVPPVRPMAAWAPNTDLPVGALESRTRQGADLDGVLLRHDDPAEVVQSLRRAGADLTHDADAWLRAHRRTISDPEEIRSTQRLHGRLVWLERSSYLFIGIAVLLGGWGGGDDPPWPIFIATMAAIAAFFVVRFLARRGMKRTRTQNRL